MKYIIGSCIQPRHTFSSNKDIAWFLINSLTEIFKGNVEYLPN